MKRLIAAAILMVLIVGIYLTGYFYIEKICKETEKMVKECVTAYKENRNVNPGAQKLKSYWCSKEKMLSIFANHNSIDEIELAIDLLWVHGKYREDDLFYEYSTTLQMLLHQLMEDTEPSAHSIL